VQSGFEVVVTPLDVPGAQQQNVSLRPDVENPGMYEGYFSPTKAGRYRVEANSGDRDLSNTTEFQVTDIQPELANTDMQIETLRRIADMSGGKCLGMLQVGELPALLNLDRHEDTYTTEVPLWDNLWVMLLVVVLMGSEWIVRRRYDLP
jgi:hypothetical protein